MRAELILQNSSCLIPYNYNSAISTFLYSCLNHMNKTEFKKICHIGCIETDVLSFKLFTFSMLRASQYKHHSDGIELIGDISLSISSPYRQFLESVGKSSENLIDFLIGREHFKFSAKGFHLKESLDFSSSVDQATLVTERFTCLSPIVISMMGKGGSTFFLKHTDEMFKPRILRNLLKKFELIHGFDYIGDTFIDVDFDADYIQKTKGNIFKKIEVNNIHVRGTLAPFHLTLSPQLMKIAYECGFGERGSMGFGMIEKLEGAKTSVEFEDVI